MAPTHEVYQLDGAKIRELRMASEAPTQEQFEARSRNMGAPVSRRTLQDVEHNTRPVSQKVRNRIARVLGVPPESITADTLPSHATLQKVNPSDKADPDWIGDPELSLKQRRLLVAAIRLQVGGRPDGAAGRCRKLLEQVSKQDRFEDYARVLVRLVTFLDEAGRHQEALKHLDEFYEDIDRGYVCSPLCRDWADYHKGICLRRMAKKKKDMDLYAAAEKIFLRLAKTGGSLAAGAKHQLAVVYLHQGAKATGARRSGLLRKSEGLFKWARVEWKGGTGAFREAHPLRRLGQLYAMQGRFDESLEMFLDALAEFSRYHARKYVRDVRKDIREYISDPVLVTK